MWSVSGRLTISSSVGRGSGLVHVGGVFGCRASSGVIIGVATGEVGGDSSGVVGDHPKGVIDRIRIDAFWERCNRPINCVYVCSFAWNTKNIRKTVERKNDFLVFDDKGNRDCLVNVLSDPNTIVEFKDKQWTNFFVDMQKTIKVDGEKDLGNVGIIKEGWINDSTFMKEASFEVFKYGSFIVRETLGTVMHGDIVGGVLVVFMNDFRHFEPKRIISTNNTKDRENNGNVKHQDKEQISMREFEYRIEEHYERDDDDDHDGLKIYEMISIDEGFFGD
ncbi:hypothetical protein Tco_1058252 [Tanacetum coccineum]|uniref:Uncharacterized protein n=1 Tax=Tanacetum coccineum TaxID=301880 RepID=A0ABQ5H992_9ASTR